jgi:hypothetical protein
MARRTGCGCVGGEFTTEDTENTEQKMRFCIKLKSAEIRGRLLDQLAIPCVLSVSSVVKQNDFANTL